MAKPNKKNSSSNQTQSPAPEEKVKKVGIAQVRAIYQSVGQGGTITVTKGRRSSLGWYATSCSTK